jgi:hypothetical protein
VEELKRAVLAQEIWSTCVCNSLNCAFEAKNKS